MCLISSEEKLHFNIKGNILISDKFTFSGLAPYFDRRNRTRVININVKIGQRAAPVGFRTTCRGAFQGFSSI